MPTRQTTSVPRAASTSGDASRGAYGLRLVGMDSASSLLVAADPAWPAVEIHVEVAEQRTIAEHLDERSARIRLRTGGWIEIDRHRGRARYVVPVPLSPDELVHPYLAPVAAVSAHWHGRESLHGGGFVAGGGVWGIVGDRLGGKSSLLAALAARGVAVLADDVLVVEGDEVFAGPRTIDLRGDSASVLAIGENIGVAGTRERWRLRLEPIEPRARLAGWIFTAWSGEIGIRRVPAPEVLARLLANRAITALPRLPEAFLELSLLPAWELSRPRSWDVLPATIERLLVTVRAA